MIFRHLLNMRSHPTWVRGLKHSFLAVACYLLPVAPYVGAWIETGWKPSCENTPSVAPYVGAWIETFN